MRSRQLLLPRYANGTKAWNTTRKNDVSVRSWRRVLQAARKAEHHVRRVAADELAAVRAECNEAVEAVRATAEAQIETLAAELEASHAAAVRR